MSQEDTPSVFGEFIGELQNCTIYYTAFYPILVTSYMLAYGKKKKRKNKKRFVPQLKGSKDQCNFYFYASLLRQHIWPLVLQYQFTCVVY